MSKKITNKIDQILGESELILNIPNDIDLWNNIYSTLEYQPIFLDSLHLNYSNLYNNDFYQIKLGLIKEGKICGLFSFSIIKIKDKYIFESYRNSIYPPFYIENINKKIKKRYNDELLNLIKKISKLFNDPIIMFNVDFLPKFKNNGLSEWGENLLDSSSDRIIISDSYINLSLNEDLIKSNIRKSYKPLITKGLKIWSNEVYDHVNITTKVWSIFKQLHLDVAGRITRSDFTWNIQLEMILNRSAIFVALYDTISNDMVGGALVLCSRDEAVYSVAAYKRDLFHLPIGHPIQWLIIKKLKLINVEWYYLGEKYLKNSPDKTSKEINISEFKSGFSTGLYNLIKIKNTFNES